MMAKECQSANTVPRKTIPFFFLWWHQSTSRVFKNIATPKSQSTDRTGFLFRMLFHMLLHVFENFNSKILQGNRVFLQHEYACLFFRVELSLNLDPQISHPTSFPSICTRKFYSTYVGMAKLRYVYARAFEIA